jgi:hypothetical protein
MADLTPEQQKLLDEFDSLREALKSAGVDVDKFARRSVKSLSDQMARLDKEVKKSGTNYKNAGDALAALKEAIEEDTKEYTTAKQKRAALDQLEKRARLGFVQNITDAGLRIGGVLLAGYANYFINQAKTTVSGLMGGSSPFRLAADLQTAAADDFNTTLHGVTGAVESAAGPMALLATAAGIASGGTAFLAAGLFTAGAKLVNFLSDKATDIFKFRVQKLGDALEVLTKSYNSAAGAGAVFAGGMDEFKTLQTEAALSQEQFAGVLSRNSYNLADSGLGVTEATKLLSGTVGKFTKMTGQSGITFRDQMQNLGFDIEAQGDLAADVISMVKRAGRQLVPEELAQETLEYAKNLRVIQEITGEDARKKVAESKRLTESFGFQTRFLKATGGNAKALEDYTVASAKYPPVLQKAIQQAARLGTVTDFDAIQAGYKDVAENIGAQIRAGNINIADFDRMVSDNLQGFTASGHEQQLAMDQANAATGVFGGTIEALTEKTRYAYAYQNGGLDKLTGTVNQAAETSSGFNTNINLATDRLNDMKVALQNDVTPALRKFANDVPEILKAARQKLIDAGILEGPKSLSGSPGGFDLNAEKTRNRANPYAVGPDFVNPDNINQWAMDRQKGKASGGISQGPESGYNEVLHGTEAVVPLPNNRSIPVSLDSSSITAAVHQQTGVLSEILRVMQNNNSLTSQIVQNSY